MIKNISFAEVIRNLKESYKINSDQICKHIREACTFGSFTKNEFDKIESGKVPSIEQATILALAFNLDVELTLEAWKIDQIKKLRNKLDNDIEFELFKIKKNWFEGKYQVFKNPKQDEELYSTPLKDYFIAILNKTGLSAEEFMSRNKVDYSTNYLYKVYWGTLFPSSRFLHAFLPVFERHGFDSDKIVEQWKKEKALRTTKST